MEGSEGSAARTSIYSRKKSTPLDNTSTLVNDENGECESNQEEDTCSNAGVGQNQVLRANKKDIVYDSLREKPQKKVSMKKSTRNSKTKEIYDTAEVLSSQNNSQFIIFGISPNPDEDTISHEAYGTFANDMLHSSLGIQFTQQFVSGWAFAKESFQSGVEKATSKDGSTTNEESVTNTVTQVVSGARQIVKNTVSRYKSRNSGIPKKSSSVDIFQKSGTEIPSSSAATADYSIVLEICENELNNSIFLLLVNEPGDDGSGNNDFVGDEDTSDVEVGSTGINQLESTGAGTANNVSVRHGGSLETEAESPEMDQLMETQERELTDDAVLLGAGQTSEKTIESPEINTRNSKGSGSARDVSVQNGNISKKKVMIREVNNQSVKVTDSRRHGKRKTKSPLPIKNVSLTKKPRKNIRRSQVDYVCPKCGVNYEEDEGVDEWVQFSGSNKCPVWAHVQCMEGDFECSNCQK